MIIEILYEFTNEYWQGLIALLALALTIYQGWTTRLHNQYSVRPSLAHEMGWSPLEPDGESTFLLSLKNNGLGPAMIYFIFFKYEGELIEVYTPSGLQKYGIKKFENMNVGVSVHGLLRGYYLKSGEERKLLTVDIGKSSTDKIDVIEKIASNFGFYVEYRDMYGKVFTYQTGNTKLSWKKRRKLVKMKYMADAIGPLK